MVSPSAERNVHPQMTMTRHSSLSHPSEPQELWAGTGNPGTGRSGPEGRGSLILSGFRLRGSTRRGAPRQVAGGRRELPRGAQAGRKLRRQPGQFREDQTLEVPNAHAGGAEAPPSFLPHPPTREITRLRRPRCRGQYKRNSNLWHGHGDNARVAPWRYSVLSPGSGNCMRMITGGLPVC